MQDTLIIDPEVMHLARGEMKCESLEACNETRPAFKMLTSHVNPSYLSLVQELALLVV